MAVEAMLLSVVKWLLAVEVVVLLTAMWPLKVLVAEVGFLVLAGAMSGRGVRGDEETNFMPPTRGIGRISNNFDATLK